VLFRHPALRRADLSPLRPHLLARPPLPAAALAAIAGHLTSLRPWSPSAPGATRLLAGAGIEVWLRAWAPGERLAAHDHGGAVGAFAVVEGALVEECLDLTMWTTCRRTTFPAGSRSCFGPGHVHLLAAAGGAPALSVHAASPPGRPLRFGPGASRPPEPATAAR
jgi:hypothetical protein